MLGATQFPLFAQSVALSDIRTPVFCMNILPAMILEKTILKLIGRHSFPLESLGKTKVTQGLP